MTIWQQQQHQPVSTIETRKRTNLFVLLFPATAWLLLFFIVPLLIVLLYSFLERGIYGGVTWTFTLSNLALRFQLLMAVVLVPVLIYFRMSEEANS
jgi:spermidine/putrescine transport system permease protein